MTIHRYITRKYLRSLLIVLIAFFCLGYIQELATGTGATVEGEDSFSAEQLLLSLLFVPQFVFENLPMVFLLSSIHFCLFFLRSKEYLALKSFGTKGQNVTLLSMVIAFILGMICLALVNPLVAWTNIQTQQLKLDNAPDAKVEINQERFWFQVKIQEKDAIIRAARLDLEDKERIHLEDVEIYFKGVEGTPLENYCKASEIHVQDQYLEISPEARCDLESELTRSTDIGSNTLRVLLKTDISPEDFVALIPLEHTTVWSSSKIANTLEKLGLLASAHEQRVYLFSLISLPFLLAFMAGLGVGILPFFELTGLYKGSFLIFIFGLGIFFLDKVLNTFVVNQDFPNLIASLFFPFPILIIVSIFVGIVPLSNFQIPKFEKSFIPFVGRLMFLFILNMVVNLFLFPQILLTEYAALFFALFSSLLLFILLPYIEKRGKHILHIKVNPLHNMT